MHTKSFSSKRNKISDKNINNPNSENYSLNNYYKIPNIGLQQNKEIKKKKKFGEKKKIINSTTQIQFLLNKK